jgi:hypothetical protein
MAQCQTDREGPKARTFQNLAIAVGLGAIGFYLFTEHRAHLWGALPFLILLSCPLMHLFMHHGHRDHKSPGDGFRK